MRFPVALNCNSLLLFAIVVSLLLIDAAGASAQSAERTRIWVALGLGPGAPRVVSEYGFRYDVDAAVFQAVYQKRGHQFALRGATVSGPWVDLTSLSETGVTYGRTKTGELGHASFSSGLSWVRACTGSRGANSRDDCNSTLGLPLVAEVAFRPFSFIPVFGIGGQAFANLNNITVYRGLVVFVQLGWMP